MPTSVATIRPPSPLGCIKGIAFRELLRWYREQRNPADLRVAIMRLPAGQRELFDMEHPYYGILSSTWYPAEMVTDVPEAFARMERGETIRSVIVFGD